MMTSLLFSDLPSFVHVYRTGPLPDAWQNKVHLVCRSHDIVLEEMSRSIRGKSAKIGEKDNLVNCALSNVSISTS